MDFEISKIVSSYAQLGSELKEGAPVRVPLNAVNGPVLVHYLVVLTGLQTS